MWARIDTEGRFVETTLENPEGRFPPTLTFVEVPEYLQRYINNTCVYDEATGWFTDNLSTFVNIMLNSAASARYNAVQNGTIEWEGNTYVTDKETQAVIGGNVQTGKRFEELGGTFSTVWKSKTGFVTLNLIELQNMGLAVAQFVQSMFKLESDVTEAVLEADNTLQGKIEAYETAYELYFKPLEPEPEFVPVDHEEPPEPVFVEPLPPYEPEPVEPPPPPEPLPPVEPPPVLPLPPGVVLQKPVVVAGTDAAEVDSTDETSDEQATDVADEEPEPVTVTEPETDVESEPVAVTEPTPET